MDINNYPGIKRNISLSALTNIAFGGPAKLFLEMTSIKQLTQLLPHLSGTRFYILGSGTNIIPADEGFDGLIIKISIDFLEIKGDTLTVGAGYNLTDFIFELNKKGLAGLEKMAGIPGTVGGAIYGNAGAYGQEIKDHLESVTFLDLSRHSRVGGNPFNNLSMDPRILVRFRSPQEPEDDKTVVTLPSSQLGLAYRTSDFKKHKDWIILSATFKLSSAQPDELLETSQEIMKMREERYPLNLKYPGSFFKNIVLDSLSESERENLLAKVDPEKVKFGKVPVGHLLEEIGSKGMKIGGIAVTTHHANLIYNTGNGTYKELKELVTQLKEKVFQKFGIQIEEEVQFI